MSDKNLVWKFEMNEWLLASKQKINQTKQKKKQEKLVQVQQKQQNVRQIGTLVLTSEGVGILQQQVTIDNYKSEINVKVNQQIKKFMIDDLIFEIPLFVTIYHNDARLTNYKIYVPIYTSQEGLLKNIEGLILDGLNINEEEQGQITPSFKAYCQKKELIPNNQQIANLDILADSKILVISSSLSMVYQTLKRYTQTSYWCYGNDQILIESTTVSFSKNVTFMGFGLFSFKEYSSSCSNAGQTTAAYMVRFFANNNINSQPLVEMKFTVNQTPEAEIFPCIFKKPQKLQANQKYVCQIENCQGGHNSFYGTGGLGQYEEDKVMIKFENTPDASYTQFSTVQIPEIYYSVI